MSRSILLRVAALQTALVAVLSIGLVLAVGTAFFKHWGIVVGPVAWLLCSLATALILNLAPRRALLGAVLAGLPSLTLVLVGQHAVGDVVAIIAFASWCAWRPSLRGAALER